MSDDCFWMKNPTNSLSNLNSNHMNQLMDKISSDNCCAVRSILSSSHRNSCLKHLKILQTTPTLQIFSMNRPRRTRRLLSPTFKRKIRINRKKYSYFLSSFVSIDFFRLNSHLIYLQNSKYSDDIPLSSNHETLLSPSNSQGTFVHYKFSFEIFFKFV